MKTIFSFPSLDDDGFPASSLWNSLNVMGARFPTEAAAEAYAPLTDIDYVDVIDEASDADEASGIFYKTGNDGADVPAHDHFVTVAGKNFAYLSRTIKLNTLGKTVHSEVLARLEELNDKGGGELKIRDSHLVAGNITQALTADMVLDFGMTGAFVTGSGANPHVLNLTDTAGGLPLNNNHDVTLLNPRIDVSAGIGGPGTSSNQGTAISFTGFRKASVYGGHLVAGDDMDGGHGDSGITAVAPLDLLIDGVSIIGFDDNAIYISGGSDVDPGVTDDGWTAKVLNCSIQYCSNGINSKRQYHYVLAQGNSLRYCRIGLITEGADTANQPGWRYDAINNYIKKSIRHGIKITGSTKAMVALNRIEDFGYAADGISAYPTPIGIYIDGASKTLISDNRIALIDWNPAGSTIGLYIADNPDIFDTAYLAGKVTGHGNRWQNLDVGIHDSAATNESVFSNEHFDNVTTKATLNGASSITAYTEESIAIVKSAGNVPLEITNGLRSFKATLNDDTATSFQLPTSPNTYLICVGCDDTGTMKPNGMIWGRRSSPLLVNLSLTPFTAITLTNVALTGTSGSEPNDQTTLSMATGGIFWISNRTGATRKYAITVMPTD